MADPTFGIPVIDPLLGQIRNFVGAISVLVGGIFGYYIISFIVRLVYMKKSRNELREIKEDIRLIKKKLKIR